MTVSEGPGTHNTRIVKKEYPCEEGLTLGTSKISGRVYQLSAEGLNGRKTLVHKRNMSGL